MNKFLISVLSFTSVTLQSSGYATYDIKSDGYGKCSIPGNSYINWASVGPKAYQDAEICGQCIEIKNNETDAVVMAHVVDQCLDCGVGDLTLSLPAFKMLGDLAVGRLPVKWRTVTCTDITGPLQYHWKKGSNGWWGAFQILNHAQGIKSVEMGFTPLGPFTQLERKSDNFFWTHNGGPFSLKITSVTNTTVIDPQQLPLEAGGVVLSSGQV